MSNFHIDLSGVTFSAKTSSNRINKATALFGETMIKRIIVIALFLLGANRQQISEAVGMPIGTLFTFLTRFNKRGIVSLSTGNQTEKVEPSVHPTEVIYENAGIKSNLDFSRIMSTISPPAGNDLQHKVLVLSFFKWGAISCAEAAEQLGFSERHIRDLSLKLEVGDVYDLIDKRQGQQQDYNVTTDVKAELIQQFAFNVVTGKPTSSHQLCQQVNGACGTSITDRSIRIHISKLGLKAIKKSLFSMVDDFKKKCKKLVYEAATQIQLPLDELSIRERQRLAIAVLGHSGISHKEIANSLNIHEDTV
jgi:transposase